MKSRENAIHKTIFMDFDFCISWRNKKPSKNKPWDRNYFIHKPYLLFHISSFTMGLEFFDEQFFECRTIELLNEKKRNYWRRRWQKNDTKNKTEKKATTYWNRVLFHLKVVLVLGISARVQNDFFFGCHSIKVKF